MPHQLSARRPWQGARGADYPVHSHKHPGHVAIHGSEIADEARNAVRLTLRFPCPLPAERTGKIVELRATMDWRTVLNHILKVLGRRITDQQMGAVEHVVEGEDPHFLRRYPRDWARQAPNPKPQTPNPKPQTPNPKPQTPNPKPQTPHPKPHPPSPKP